MQNYRLVLFSHSTCEKTHQALNFSPGDKICLFGFSRGGKQGLHSNLLSDVPTTFLSAAYTARVVMGMLYKV
jgi:guanylate kinase